MPHTRLKRASDLDVIAAADHVVDLGPGAAASDSPTSAYLRERLSAAG